MGMQTNSDNAEGQLSGVREKTQETGERDTNILTQLRSDG